MIKKMNGLTLLEVILVLAIMTSIILMGLQWFQTLVYQNNYMILKSNVDQLFLALRQYYQANCGLVSSTNKFFQYPSNQPQVVVLSMNDIKPYLPQDWPRTTPVAEDDSYIYQFNLYLNSGSQYPQRSTYVCFQLDPSKPTPCDTPGTTVIDSSKIHIWQIQVMVKMRDPAQAYNYRAVAGASCAASAYSDTAAADCSASASLTEAIYLVWQGAPADVAPEMRSTLWMMDPVIKEYKLQYTHDPMYEMYNPNAVREVTQPYTYQNVDYQNYLCGG